MSAVPGVKVYGTLWAGQCASLLGSNMTNFAVTLWAWEQTGQATPLSLLFFFAQVAKIAAATFSGVLVDRYSRQKLMIVGNAIAGLSSICILVLLQTHQLALWHLYFSCAINGLFSYIQSLALSTSVSLLLPEHHYGRAGAMDSLKGAGAFVFAPAFAGALYPFIGLLGILGIDLATFGFAAVSLFVLHIPQPLPISGPETIRQKLTFGFRYIVKQPGLKAILIFLFSANFFTSASIAILPAVILARSENDIGLLATFQSALGCGGVFGALLLAIFGVFTPRIHGLFLGVALPQLGWLILSVTQAKGLWIVAAFLSACFIPLVGASNQAIWLAKVKPALQGRVFATRYLLAQASTPLGAVISGPLADRIFEPAMQNQGILAKSFVGSWLGTGQGMGLTLELMCFATCNLVIGLSGYGIRRLRYAEVVLQVSKPSLRE
ncbi:hypothetical protein C1752_03491 [Acaryochloris thomasi RCC1774]|uniref:MFS transporter n=1 Tax=Acaryochloris thomasi RCC1774 TaxID=1764569 RepID=A0A2W1JMH4_9CYAN|nr:MFS transporter [Acaryochloris thomasi]PZD72655.1 hypothetical protein C1752_03491 [Acaryochloris thomasi RCC1774]